MSTKQQGNTTWMIYGAGGYTGRLVAEEAKRRGMTPVLAGRREDSVRPLAEQLGLEWKAFALDDATEIVRNIEGLGLVLNCAGPFSATYAPMVEACLQAKVSYLDITGEIEIFEAIFRRDQEAKDKGIALLPGVGFDVVPTDCLAASLAHKHPGAKALTLAIMTTGRPSPGTTKTAIEGLPKGGVVRKDGKLVSVPAAFRTQRVVFPSGERRAVAIPWGDVATAYHSTQIPDITTLMTFPGWMISAMKLTGHFKGLFARKSVQDFLQAQVAKRVKGPSEEQRKQDHIEIWGEVVLADGTRHTGTMITPEGYDCTVLTALACVEKTLAGSAGTGAKTPSLAFGPGFAASLPGITMHL